MKITFGRIFKVALLAILVVGLHPTPNVSGICITPGCPMPPPGFDPPGGVLPPRPWVPIPRGGIPNSGINLMAPTDTGICLSGGGAAGGGGGGGAAVGGGITAGGAAAGAAAAAAWACVVYGGIRMYQLTPGNGPAPPGGYCDTYGSCFWQMYVEPIYGLF